MITNNIGVHLVILDQIFKIKNTVQERVLEWGTASKSQSCFGRANQIMPRVLLRIEDPFTRDSCFRSDYSPASENSASDTQPRIRLASEESAASEDTSDSDLASVSYCLGIPACAPRLSFRIPPADPAPASDLPPAPPPTCASHHLSGVNLPQLPTFATRPTQANKPIVDDVMAVDWMSNAGRSVSPKPGSAMRVTILKLKENLGEDEKAKVLEVIGGIKDEFQAIEEVCLGENFSHERAKGYTIASIVVLPGQADLEALDSNSELVNLQKEKIGDSIESTVVVDYVVPPPLVA